MFRIHRLAPLPVDPPHTYRSGENSCHVLSQIPFDFVPAGLDQQSKRRLVIRLIEVNQASDDVPDVPLIELLSIEIQIVG